MQTIINHIKAEDTLGNIEICKIDDQNIFIMDYAGFEKYFNFHIVPPTKEWLASRFLWAPSAEKYKKQYQDNFEAVVNEEIYRRTQRRRAIQSNDVVNKIIGE